eukprot:13702458-Heterocapsa_arctica.AAC.1
MIYKIGPRIPTISIFPGHRKQSRLTELATRKHTTSRLPSTRAWKASFVSLSPARLCSAQINCAVATGHPRMGAAA